jgi:signal transduction histidine kinase
MFNKPSLYFLAKMMAVTAAITIYYSANVDITSAVISTLSFACVFLLEILLDRVINNKDNKMIMATISFTMIACFMLGMETYFPLFIVLLIHLLDISIKTKMFYTILMVAVFLSFFIFTPGKIISIITVILFIFLLFSRFVLLKLLAYNSMYMEQKETISELNQKLNDIRGLTKTLKYTVSIEERNRIAARIHDQIGHGISGSIIMLEAAMLIMKDNQEKAVTSIQKAITNLREGVDEIRAALKEERAGRYQLGINDVTAILEEFKVTYNKSILLRTTGDLDFITLEMWACIHDNLKECLTNVLKHSTATEFILNIEVFKKIIKVEYKDNGKSVENFEKGMGLEAIEERTINAKGRCFFNKSENGFSVTNIFTY